MSSDTWYYVQDGASVGPLPQLAIEALIRARAVRPDTLVSPGYGDWVPAGHTVLAPLFAAMPSPAPPREENSRKDYLPKDPRKRILAQVAIAIVGLYFMFSGFTQMRGGMNELVGDTSVTLTGCRGIGADAVQCGFQNMAQANRRMCLDVVILCNDGRHVAPTCSDDMLPGASSVKVVNNFSPAINASMTCSNLTYENVKTKG